MEGLAIELAEVLVSRLQTLPLSSRLLVGLAGVPASGKSSLAKAIVDHANNILVDTSAVVVGLDGWHFTRAQLDLFQDPKLAYDRRGVHWTFDADSYLTFVRLLRQDLSLGPALITAPSFDHALKDPILDAISIRAHDRIILIEGLYTLLSIDPWREAAELLDERWLLEVDADEGRERLMKRHVLSGVARDADEAAWRTSHNDIPNGVFVMNHLVHPTRIIQSVDDPTLAE